MAEEKYTVDNRQDKANQLRKNSLVFAYPVDRLKGSRPLWLLACGDLIVFLLFAAIGRRSHGEDAGLQAIAQIGWTALPFIIGWFIAAPFVGAFSRDNLRDPKKMEIKTLQSWLAAWPIGLFLHFLFKQELPSLSSLISFGLVTLITNSLLLSLLRLPFAFVTRRKLR